MSPDYNSDPASATTDESRLSKARTKMTERAGAARDRVGNAYGSARERSSEAYGAARDRASQAYGSARSGVSRASERTAAGIESNPIAAVAGGLAIGAIVAALLPKTRREEELLGETSRRLNDKAKQAGQAAREAGTGKLEEMGLTRETAKQKLGEIASQAGEAARTSAQAAAQSVKTGSEV